jgi:hypothetical protein
MMAASREREMFCKDCKRVTVRRLVGVVEQKSVLSTPAWWCVDGSHRTDRPLPPTRA